MEKRASGLVVVGDEKVASHDLAAMLEALTSSFISCAVSIEASVHQS